MAVLPWGATEAHNYHLPYGTDVYEADAIAEAAGKKADRELGAGAIGAYMHSTNEVSAQVLLSCETDFVSKNEEFVALARDIAMHVAAFNPLCLSESDLDPEIIEREKAIYMVQAEESGKPKEIMEKMIEGKLKRFLSEVSLLSQGFVKDSEISIQELLDSKNAKIESYSRLKVGEGIEVESKSFADEVAEQLK